MKSIFSRFGIRTTNRKINPATDFFVSAPSRERKRVYDQALKAAERDQLRIIMAAKEKAGA